MRVSRAFTLIELLVVVSVIAILAGMLLPAIGLVRASAQAARCASNQRQLMLGVEAYRGDNESYYPPVAWSTAYLSDWNRDPGQGRWQHLLESYLGTFQVCNCPVTAGARPTMAVRDAPAAARGTASAASGICLLAYNQQYWGRAPDSSPNPGPMTRGRVDALVALAVPGRGGDRCPLFIDGTWCFAAPAYDGNIGVNQWGAYLPHRQRFNAAFPDGHVESRLFAEWSFAGNATLIP